MAVILHKNDPLIGHGERLRRENRCTPCGSTLLFPFVWWRDATDIFICSKCAEHMRMGLVADLIQCASIKELQRACPLYGSQTLVRQSRKDAEADAVREREEFNRKFFADEAKKSNGAGP